MPDELEGFARYAVYFAPEAGSALDRFGAAWLGRDAAGREVPRLVPSGLPLPVETLTAAPRRYCFHGTLKAPFRLADGRTAAGLDAALAALAARTTAFDAPPLAPVARGFLALRPVAGCAALDALASACVTELDGFRAPPEPTEMARRRAAGLSAAEERNLRAWGYPCVLDRFAFHLTLTGSFPAATLAATAEALAPLLAPFAAAPLRVRELCLFGDPGGGAPFRLLRRHPLGAAVEAGAAPR